MLHIKNTGVGIDNYNNIHACYQEYRNNITLISCGLRNMLIYNGHGVYLKIFVSKIGILIEEGNEVSL